MNIRTGIIALFLLAASMARAGDSAGASPSGERGKVTVMFHWKAQAQWAGFYMAKEKGIYEKHGLDVTLLPRQGRSDSLDPLLDGRVDFATHFLSAGVGLRGLKHPIVLVGQFFNRSNLMIVARRSMGVEKLTDLSGKTVAYWDNYFAFVFRAFFRNQGVKNYIERPMGLSVTQFTAKQVAACSAMEYNEYNLIQTSPGVDPDDLLEFRLRELGMDFPEDALYTTAEMAHANPEVCRAMVAATLEGWAYARDHPEETLEVVMRMVKDDPDELVTREHSDWMLKRCIESVFPPEGSPRRPGVLLRSDFEAIRRFLKETNQLRHDFEYEDFVRLAAFDPRAGG